MAWWTGKVEGEIFDGIRDDVAKRLRDRSVWKIGLDEFATSRVGIGGRFVCCLDTKESKRECRGFHAGEVGGEGEIHLFLFVVVCVW